MQTEETQFQTSNFMKLQEQKIAVFFETISVHFTVSPCIF